MDEARPVRDVDLFVERFGFARDQIPDPPAFHLPGEHAARWNSLELSSEHVIVSHGEPVLSRKEFERALWRPRWRG